MRVETWKSRAEREADTRETVSYDVGYDDAGRSLTSVACSDGENGLITKYGWYVPGSRPTLLSSLHLLFSP